MMTSFGSKVSARAIATDCCCNSLLVGTIAVAVRDVEPVRLVFQMLGDGQRIEAVAQRLCDADLRPDVPVTEDAVRVQVHDHCLVPGGVGKHDGAGVC